MKLLQHARSLVGSFYGQAITNVEPDAITLRSATSLALKVASTTLSFIISLLLARTLSANGYGVYVYAIAWTNLLIGPSTLGFDRLLVRQVSVYGTEAAWSPMRGLMREARRFTLVTSVGLSAAAALLVWVLVSPTDRQMRATIWLALLSVPIMALITVQQSIAQGLKQVILAQLPITLIRPATFIIIILTLRAVTGAALLPSQAMGLNLIVTLLTLAIGGKLLSMILPKEVKASIAHQGEGWVRHAWPLFWLGSFYLLNSQMDTLMLGTMRAPNEVAVYNIANRMAELMTFTLIAVSVTIAPTIAELWARGEVERLQRVLKRSVRIIAAVSLPLAIGLLVFGSFVLRLFGPEFVVGYRALVILTGGQMVNALAGSVGLILVMTNHERDVIIAHLLSLFVIVLLGSVLIPLWGIEGIAAARFSSLIFWNIFLVSRVRSRLRINPTVFGR
ncbi:MAG: flippase [Pyrinomonadaceae bacterium]|nr:flippase [Pyrinomonadaceae bacterium]